LKDGGIYGGRNVDLIIDGVTLIKESMTENCDNREANKT
jgi:hypothetical protein